MLLRQQHRLEALSEINNNWPVWLHTLRRRLGQGTGTPGRLRATTGHQSNTAAASFLVSQATLKLKMMTTETENSKPVPKAGSGGLRGGLCVKSSKVQAPRPAAGVRFVGDFVP